MSGAGSGWNTRKSPRPQSKRQAGRSITKEGVKKSGSAQTGRPKSLKGQDLPEVLVRKLEIARQFSVTLIGAQELQAMFEGLDMGYFEVIDHFLDVEGMKERLGVIFGSKYANHRRTVAVNILKAHKAYLADIERQKRRAHNEKRHSRKGNKPATVKRRAA